MHSDDQSMNESLNQPRLSEDDARAIDRIFEHGPESFIPETENDHAAMALLSLIGTPVAHETQRPSRVDLVALLASRLGSDDAGALTLSPEDQLALDTYLEHGYDPSGLDPELGKRAAKLDRIGSLLTAPVPGDRDSLVERTLSRIQDQIDQRESAMRVGERGRGSFSLRWSDLISVAAMLLLAASVVMPIMSGIRANAQQNQCNQNMLSAANAFGMYTGSNRGMLPMATAGLGPTWMDVGTTPERSNSSNLYTLIRNKFTALDDLACPSNPNAATGKADPKAWDWNSLPEISYSYRIMPPGGMRASSASHPVGVVLLADRSPVVLRVARNQPIIPEENSPNHNGAGQHMLMLDGSSRWATTPMLDNKDNIWLPRPIERVIHEARSRVGIITGNEQPDGPTDAFVGP